MLSLPLRKCGLKYHCKPLSACSPIRHFPCGSVDWNIQLGGWIYSPLRHFPCGSVDWNVCWPIPHGIFFMSLPLRKCGLKYFCQYHFCNLPTSLPLRKCGLKCTMKTCSMRTEVVTSLAEVWIEIGHLSIGLCSSQSLPLRKCGLKLY